MRSSDQEVLGDITITVDTAHTVVLTGIMAPGDIYLTIENYGLGSVNADVSSDESGQTSPLYSLLADPRINDPGYPIVSGEIRRVDIPRVRPPLLSIRVWALAGTALVRVKLRRAVIPVGVR